MESINALLIQQNLSQNERLIQLNKVALVNLIWGDVQAFAKYCFYIVKGRI